MLRFSLFLLLSLAVHVAGSRLHGTTQRPALSAAQTADAPQVLRLAAVLQAAPAALPEQPQPLRQVAVSQALAVKPSAPVPTAKPQAIAVPAETPPGSALARAPNSPAVSPTVTADAAPAAPAAPAAAVAAPPLAEVLSRQPSFRQPPRQPSYPSQARRRNQQGVVLVEVRLDARGRQRSLSVLRSSGVDSLDRAALEAVAQWHFRPETAGGQAVPSRVQIPIKFALTASR
ncbi:energy transducer TonB [uncultured Pseudomonas sp.]|uniref:energy transducer TonB n=1 Tax=uncultured Pseudomonas sp. TaxID=114707 RepID=UPI002633FBCF|nr:energy transducer TonB [uncultured Pseudomonas sp.]